MLWLTVIEMKMIWKVLELNEGLTWVRGHSRIESSHSFRQNDGKFQTHPPSTLHAKMQTLPKISVTP